MQKIVWQTIKKLLKILILFYSSLKKGNNIFKIDINFPSFVYLPSYKSLVYPVPDIFIVRRNRDFRVSLKTIVKLQTNVTDCNKKIHNTLSGFIYPSCLDKQTVWSIWNFLTKHSIWKKRKKFFTPVIIIIIINYRS